MLLNKIKVLSIILILGIIVYGCGGGGSSDNPANCICTSCAGLGGTNLMDCKIEQASDPPCCHSSSSLSQSPLTSPKLSDAKALISFKFISPAVSGTINEDSHTISVAVPYETNVTALVGTFTTSGTSVYVGSTAQVSGETANNFTSPVVYTVTAEDGSTVAYTVTVTPQLSEPG